MNAPDPQPPFLTLRLFEGPLDLLLHLCRRHEIEVTELPVAQVTRQFLAYLDVMRELQVEVAGEFIEMAALLCLLKSREMLPAVSIAGDDDDAEQEDPRAKLIERLLEYRRFREAALDLDALPRPGRDFWTRSPLGPQDLPQEEAPIEADITALLAALRDVLEQQARIPPIHEVADPALSLVQRMRAVMQVLAEGPAPGVDFTRFFDADRGRPMVVVTLLALLELARLRHVRLRQAGHLHALVVCRRWAGAPPCVEEPDGR